jgi:hypothetical protein
MPKTVLVIDLEGNTLTPSYGDEIGLVVPNDCIARPVNEFHHRYPRVQGRLCRDDGQKGGIFDTFKDVLDALDTAKNSRTYHKGPHSTKAEWRKSMKGKKR